MNQQQGFYWDKKVVVTGASGLLGTHLIPDLVAAGASVRAVVRNRPFPLRDPNIEVVRADLREQSECDRVMEGMDAACLCASITVGAAQAIRNPMLAVTDNLVMGARCLQAACTAGVERLLLVSSTTVYPPADRPVTEEEATVGEPHPAYQGVANMKRYLEKLAKFYYDHYDLKVAIVRPVPFYGRYDNFDLETCHVIPALIRKAVEGYNPFEVWGTGKDVRDFLHVKDVSRGCLLALEKAPECEDFSLGCGTGISIAELARTIVRLANHDAPIVFAATKPSTLPVRLVDISKAEVKLGFEPQVSLEAGLADTVDWFRTHREKILENSPVFT